MNATEPITRVRFYGHLRNRFGDGYPLSEVRSAAHAIRALHHVLPGFSKYMREHSVPGYRVIVNDEPVSRDEELEYPCQGKVVQIVPVVAGAAGAGKILAGAALIGLSFMNPGFGAFLGTSISQLGMNIGIGMALGAYSGPAL
jgi:predicted phage tail protein